MGIGMGLEYSSRDASGFTQYGKNWMPHGLAGLAFVGNDVIYQEGPRQMEYYDEASGVYTPRFYVRSVLKKITPGGGAPHYFLMTLPDGERRKFDSDGKLVAIHDAFGHVAEVSWSGSEVDAVTLGDGTTDVEYDYTWSGGRLQNVIYSVGSTAVRRQSYEYTGSGELQKVILEEPNGAGWAAIETTYFAYHGGGTGRLKYVLGHEAYDRWQAAGGSTTVLEQYADHEYAYNSDGTVSQAKTKGGTYVTSYSYRWNVNTPADLNHWASKITETRPDTSVVTYYTNSAGQLILKKVSKGGNTWYPVYQQFEAVTGRVVLKAGTSAVSTVDEGTLSLVTLHANQGLIHTMSYDSTSGRRNGWFVQRGTTPHEKSKTAAATYLPHTYQGVTIYLPYLKTAYRGTSATGADGIVTTHSYAWHEDGSSDETFQIKKETVTPPDVSTSQNGNGGTAATETHYDEWGYVEKQVDGRGIVTKYTYDRVRGGLTERIDNYVHPAPSSPPVDTNLTTNYLIDDLGRATRELKPVHKIDLAGVETEIRRAVWTQYKDASDEVVSIRGYVKILSPTTNTEHTVNPVSISRNFESDPGLMGGSMTSQIAAEYTGTGVPAKTHVFARSTWKHWSSSHFNKGGQLTHSRLYHSIPSSGSGSPASDFYAQTSYVYDSLGRRDQTTSPEGTITRQVFNAMGWPEKIEVGTSSSNLKEIRKYSYNNVAGGDGKPSKVSLAVDANSSNNRDTDLTYDFRNRLERSTANDGTRDYISVSQYDNLDRTVLAATYHDSYSSGSPNSNLITRSTSEFDNRGQVYCRKIYADTGSENTAQKSLSWYDATGNLIRFEGAGSQAFTVYTYDGLNRQVASYTGYLPSSSSSSSSSSGSFDPADISTSVIVAQGSTEFDRGGNAIQATSNARFDDATGLGELGTATSTDKPKARVSHSGSYPDAIGRSQAEVDVGANGGSAWTRPPLIPARADTTLVTSFTYDTAGDRVQSTDPAGRIDKTTYDAAGQVTQTIENYIGSSSSSSSSSSSGSSSSSSSSGVPCVGENRTTGYQHNLDGKLKKLTSYNAATGNQETQWIYGVTEAGGSEINSKDLLWKKILPMGSAGGDGTSIYKYNRQGQATEFQDAADTIHSYAYDKLGRNTSDIASNLATGVDGSILKITRAYDDHLRLSKVGSYATAGSTTPLHEVSYGYNTFGQLTADRQEHAGAVHGSTRQVGYQYADGTTTTNNNTIRPTGLTYPSSTPITTIKYTAGTAADKLSRPDILALGGTDEVAYRYLGLGQVVGVTYLATHISTPVHMTYEDGGLGTAGDKYSGLDNFGRVVETLWKKDMTVMQNASYGYDRASARKWRRDDLAHALGGAQQNRHDNFYWHDGLYQIKERQLGNLTGAAPNYTGIDNLQQNEDWCYDASGNWQKYGNTDDSLLQTRTHNTANEITSVANPTGVIQPAYDKAGNQTADIAPGDWDRQFDLKWDAWNRLIQVMHSSTVIQTNAYDGLSRRITSSDGTDTVHYYYDQSWRAVEEYLNSDSTPNRRYLWGLRSRWDLAKRERNDSGSLNEKRYVLYDAMDPVAICDEGGDITQRFEYSPFGETAFLNDDFSPDPTPADWNWLFHGEFRDRDTGYYNYGYRYYNPTTGRWINRDPIGEMGGLNLYQMVLNNLIDTLDLFGAESTETAVGDDGCRDCRWTIYGSHLLGVGGAIKRASDSAKNTSNCGDKIGFASCGQQLPNAMVGNLAIPGLRNGFNSSKGEKFEEEQIFKLKKEMLRCGFDPSSYKLNDLEEEEYSIQPKETWEAAIKSAKEECSKKSCCKSITLTMKCSPEYRQNEAVGYAAAHNMPTVKTSAEAEMLADNLAKQGLMYCGRTEKLKPCKCP
jgi:RHS repeat-associated protein